MENNFNLKIMEFYIKINKMNDKIVSKIFDFIIKANKLVDLSDGDYQIEKTLILNKISLKGYILDSDCCIQLNNNNITVYSIKELKTFLLQYEKTFKIDYSKYFLALSLYELIEDIENQVDSKINLEISELSRVISSISDIKISKNDEYETLYYKFKTQLDNYLKNNKLDGKAYNICIQTLNDIFNFYISGYPTISDKYIYHKES